MNVRQVKKDLLKDLLKIDIKALKGLVINLEKELKKVNPNFEEIHSALLGSKAIADDAIREIKRYN